METILIVAIEMLFLALTVIMYISYIGYDLRSRGFDGTFAVTVLHQNGISIIDYYRKRKEHPVLGDQYENRRMAYLFLATAIIGLLIVVLLPFASVTL